MTRARTQQDVFRRELGIDEPFCRRVFDAAKGVARRELFCEAHATVRLEMHDGALVAASARERSGLGVRAVDGTSTGYAFCELFDLRAARGAARIAAAAARGAGGPVALPSARRRPGGPGGLAPQLLGSGHAARLQSLVARIDALAATTGAVRRRLQLVESETRVLVVDGELRRSFAYRPRAQLALQLAIGPPARSIGGEATLQQPMPAEQIDDRALRALVERATRQAERRRLGTPPAAERLDVVFAAGSGGVLLHEAVGHPLEADLVRGGRSLLGSRLGQRLAPPGVTIVDDAALAGGCGSSAVDDEGISARRTVVVEEGSVSGLLHDRETAAHFGSAPTGNGRRASFRELPLPRMTNTLMLPGATAPRDILRSISRGLYLDALAVGRSDVGAGTLVLHAPSGFLIEGGRLTAPLRDIALHVDTIEMLRSIELVGDDLTLHDASWRCRKQGQSVAVSLGAPTIKVRGIDVAPA